jgi:hypothetical protein
MAMRIESAKREQRKIHEATELAKLAARLAQVDGKGHPPQNYLRDALDLILEANNTINKYQQLIDDELNDDKNGGDNHG